MSSSQSAATAAFRLDASPQIGRGHFSRCLGLARAMAERGIQPHFLMAETDSAVEPALRRHHWVFHRLPRPGEKKETPERLIREVRNLGARYVIVDSYRLAPGYFEGLRAETNAAIVQFDDFGQDRYASSLVIKSAAGNDVANSAARVISGPSNIPLRPDVLRSAPIQRKFQQRPHFILVTLGCSHVRELVPLLETFRGVPDITVHIAAPKQAKVKIPKDLLAQKNIFLHVDAPMTDLYKKAHLAVCGGGVTSLELAHWGVPMLCLMLSKDQNGNIQHLVRSGCAETVQLPEINQPKRLGKRIARILSDFPRLERMSKNGQKAVDGKAGNRIVKILLERHSFSSHGS